jgi:hypothetical protein
LNREKTRRQEDNDKFTSEVKGCSKYRNHF